MEGLRQYILSITSAAVICGIVSGLHPKGMLREFIRLLCGVFLAFTVMAPLANLNISGLLPQISLPDEKAAQDAVSLGKDYSAKQTAQIIKDEVEAYILDKAASLGCDVIVDVTLSQDEIPVPTGVVIAGEFSIENRQALTNMISEDLGITKENQKWNG